MKTKHSLIVLLSLANLVLLAALVLGSSSLPAAVAQAGARPGDFISVTAKAAGQSYDVLYVLDVRERKLFGFYPGAPPRGNLVPTVARDLTQDFRPK